MLASFEKTTDHLVRRSNFQIFFRFASFAHIDSFAFQFDAALYSKEDAIEGVSECIILGTPAKKTGTSIASLITSAPAISQPKKPLFERLYRAVHRARPA